MVDLISATLDSPEQWRANEEKVFALMQKDNFFRETDLAKEDVQSLGTLRVNREAFDYLDTAAKALRLKPVHFVTHLSCSVISSSPQNRHLLLSQFQVASEAATHVRALSCMRQIAEAASSSAVQYRATRDALKKARAEEQRAKERELARQEKERARLAERERKKNEAAAAAALHKQAAAEREPLGDSALGAADRRRRGKGTVEVGEDDAPVLREKFAGHEVPCVGDVEMFCECALSGTPALLRWRRSAIKKFLEAAGCDAKGTSAMNQLLIAEMKQFVGEFAEAIEAGQIGGCIAVVGIPATSRVRIPIVLCLHSCSYCRRTQTRPRRRRSCQRRAKQVVTS